MIASNTKMRHKFFTDMNKVIVVILLACLLAGCSSPAQAEYRKITAEQAKGKMTDSSDFILLDVRTEEEFQEQHLDGAILIPDYEIGLRAEKELPDKEALILIYCRSGRRSELAAVELVGMGYTNVYDFGGIIDWPYETVGSAQ